MTKQDVIDKIDEYKEKLEVKVNFVQDIDVRIIDYINENLNNPNRHNKYEILSVFRFIDFLYKYELRKKEVKKFFKFYELLKFPAEKGMQSFKLTPVQCFQFANIMGWYNEEGARVTREVLLFVPRKFSKTTSVASLAIYDTLFGDSNAQSYVASNSFSQSQIAFDIIKKSLKSLDPTLSNFKLNRDIIYNMMPNKSSFVRCLASSADKLDGLNASTVICDEFSQADNASLKNVLESSMGMRKNPLVVIITTASTKLETPFTLMLANDKKILEGTFENDSVFASIFEPDEGDEEGDESTWEKVQPHMDITIRKSFYKEEYKKALMNAGDMLEFRTKLLNIFCLPTVEEWVSPKIIDENTMDIDLDKLKSKPQSMCAIDLSVKGDLSAVSFGMYSSVNHMFYFKNFYYSPRQTIYNDENTEFYKLMVNKGYLKICGNEIIDYRIIANDIIATAKKLNILQVNYDSYKSKELINILKASGIKCVPYQQTYSHFTSPVESFQIGLYNDKIKLDSNPMIKWNFMNAYIDIDKMGNKKPIKKTASQKVDGAQCILMCLGAFQDYKRPVGIKQMKI